MALKFISAKRTDRELRFRIQLDTDKPAEGSNVEEFVYSIPPEVKTPAALLAFAMRFKGEAELLVKEKVKAQAEGTALPFEGKTF